MQFCNKTFGANLRAERARSGMSQKELADKAGTSVTTVSNYENGTNEAPRGDLIIAFASALKCSPNTLFGWDEEVS